MKNNKSGEKTNAMRLLDQSKTEYEALEYEVDENDLSGLHIAKDNGLDPDCVFKTLVARGDKNGISVFCIPVAEELDLKKCAAATHDKKLEMVAVKELLGLTGYIRGGCSPIGMKKKYPTYIDETAMLCDMIYVSGGKRGTQIHIVPDRLKEFCAAEYCDLIKQPEF